MQFRLRVLAREAAGRRHHVIDSWCGVAAFRVDEEKLLLDSQLGRRHERSEYVASVKRPRLPLLLPSNHTMRLRVSDAYPRLGRTNEEKAGHRWSRSD